MVPPLSVSVDPPALAVTVPPHVVAGAGVAALTTPAGYVSENAAAVSATVLALVSVTVSVDVTLVTMVDGANALPTVMFGEARNAEARSPVAVVPPSRPVTRVAVVPEIRYRLVGFCVWV